MSRFFVSPADIEGDTLTISKAEDVKHITSVLRMGKGDEITVSDSTGWEYTCTIDEVSKKTVSAVITDKQKGSKEPFTRVTLFQGVPKGSKLDDTIRKMTEIGAAGFVPVFMKRTVVKETPAYSKKVVRFRAIAEEASKQSAREIIPDVSEPVSFDEMTGMLQRFDMAIFCYENEDGKTIKDALRNVGEIPKTIALIIGPEGGFSDEEAEKLKGITEHCVSLGKTILRTETAGIAALSMILYELEL